MDRRLAVVLLLVVRVERRLAVVLPLVVRPRPVVRLRLGLPVVRGSRPVALLVVDRAAAALLRPVRAAPARTESARTISDKRALKPR